MVYVILPALDSDLEAMAMIQERAFFDPTNATGDELGVLLKTDPLTVHLSPQQRLQDSIAKTRTFLDDPDFVINKAVEQGHQDKVLAFSIWIRPVKQGIKAKPEKASQIAGRDPELDANTTRARFSHQSLQTRTKAMADRPHWYLKLLCVDPSAQRRGLGSLLLRWGIERASENLGELSAPFDVYLESSPAGMGAYHKAGFEVGGWDTLIEPRAREGSVSWPYMILKADANVHS